MNIIIVSDTREKQPWNFRFYKECGGQISARLKYGDYTVLGYEDIVVIERKKNVGELSGNLGAKQKQFEKELQRMERVKYKYLICECDQKDILSFPINSGIPKRYWYKLRMTGPLILKTLNGLCEEYGIEPFFCCDKVQAEMKAMELIKDAIGY